MYVLFYRWQMLRLDKHTLIRNRTNKSKPTLANKGKTFRYFQLNSYGNNPLIGGHGNYCVSVNCSVFRWHSWRFANIVWVQYRHPLVWRVISNEAILGAKRILSGPYWVFSNLKYFKLLREMLNSLFLLWYSYGDRGYYVNVMCN